MGLETVLPYSLVVCSGVVGWVINPEAITHFVQKDLVHKKLFRRHTRANFVHRRRPSYTAIGGVMPKVCTGAVHLTKLCAVLFPNP
jgi:hypothetical protein